MTARQPQIQQGPEALPQDTQIHIQSQQIENPPGQPRAFIITQPTSVTRRNGYQTYNVKTAVRLGSVQVVSGVLSIILAIVHIRINVHRKPISDTNLPFNWTYIFGSGIWCGALVGIVDEKVISVVLLYAYVVCLFLVKVLVDTCLAIDDMLVCVTSEVYTQVDSLDQICTAYISPVTFAAMIRVNASVVITCDSYDYSVTIIDNSTKPFIN